MKKKYFLYAAICFWAACNPTPEPLNDLAAIPYAPQNYTFDTPKKWGQPDIPADNPMTLDGIELGRRLFYDPILSRDSSISCRSCHNINAAFTDGKAVSNGIDGQIGKRSSMALVNLVFNNKTFFWDGRAKSIEDQALKPIEDHTEMDENWENVIKKLTRHKDYPTYFRKAFGISSRTEITKELAVKAIAQFERSIISKDSKFDKYLAGNVEFTDDEQFGYEMYENVTPMLPDAQCGHCHGGPQLTTNQYLNNGLQDAPTYDDFKDKGFGGISNIKNDMGKFRATSLRNIELSAPYMHDGSLKTLEEVVDHYRDGGKYSPNKDPLVQKVNLNVVQRKQLLAFLKTLTDSTFLKNKAYMSPF